MVRRFLRRIPFFESLRAFLEQWGLWPWLVAAVSAAASIAYSIWAWAWAALPLWAVPLVALALMMTLLLIIYLSLLIWQWFFLRQKRLDTTKLGSELQSFGTTIIRECRDYIRHFNDSQPVEAVIEQDGPRRITYMADAHKEIYLSHFFAERFGAKYNGYWFRLHQLGIELPVTLSWGVGTSPIAIGVFFGTMGEMLAESRIDDAKSFVTNKEILWQLMSSYKV